MQKHYDAIIIGAGMSGLACGIRLAMYDKKVLILEKHSVAGGLNSYYQKRITGARGVRKFDVGLHALTNFIEKGEKRKPFSKLLKQLRLSYDQFQLCPQTHSMIHFPDVQLKFSNDFELLVSEVNKEFPHEIDHFISLVEDIKSFNEVDLKAQYQSAKNVLAQKIKNPLLIEMIMAPLLIYGSAWENDMDYSQFVIMFKSLYFEGFSRPEGGVRTIIKLLLDKYKTLGGEIKFNQSVDEILKHNGKAVGVKTSAGDEINAKMIFSSAGLPETIDMAHVDQKAHVGKMSFMESLIVTDKKTHPIDETIVFYNNGPQYLYQQAKDYYDDQSAVICFPDNYHRDQRDGEGMIRITYIANYSQWNSLERPFYLKKKKDVLTSSMQLIDKLYPHYQYNVAATDIFSPTTVKKYTWHYDGTVYGSTDKVRDGKTQLDGLYIIGTDQGFLGIVGAMLSGISMGNLYGLMES